MITDFEAKMNVQTSDMDGLWVQFNPGVRILPEPPEPPEPEDWALVADGNQYVNIGYIGDVRSLSYKLEVDVDTNVLDRHSIFGVVSGTNLYGIAYQNGGLLYYPGEIPIPNLTGRMKIEYNYQTKDLNVNGNVYPNMQPPISPGNTTASLGKMSGEIVGNGMIGQIFSGEFWAEDEIAVDVVPVPMGDTTYSTTPAPSNCMWDKVSGAYLQNVGTGDFGFVGV